MERRIWHLEDGGQDFFMWVLAPSREEALNVAAADMDFLFEAEEEATITEKSLEATTIFFEDNCGDQTPIDDGDGTVTIADLIAWYESRGTVFDRPFILSVGGIC